MGFLKEEDLPGANCCVFLETGGSVGCIPMCDLVYRCSYLHLETSLNIHIPGPNTLGYKDLFH